MAEDRSLNYAQSMPSPTWSGRPPPQVMGARRRWKERSLAPLSNCTPAPSPSPRQRARCRLEKRLWPALLAWPSSPHGSKGWAAPTHLRFRILGATRPVGATLTIAAWNASRGEVTIANVGDSAALLVEAVGSRLLTEEHRLSDSAEERSRVIASGSMLAQAKSRATGEPGARPGAYALVLPCPNR
jgi:hypothetical protein